MQTIAESGSADSAPRRPRLRDNVWWQGTVGAGAVVAGALAVAVTLQEDFLRYPGWLAAQKADFVIGPAFTGLYWLRRRPQSPFGLMLITWGFIGALYILQSSGNSWLFTTGLFWEKVFGLATYVLILAFPTGRLDLPAKILVTGGVVTVLALAIAIQLLQPQVGAGGSISSCRVLCPRNHLSVTSDPELAQKLFKVFSYSVLVLAGLTAALLVYRYVRGTRPQRRALAIGLPVAFLFLACEITFQLLNITGAVHGRFYSIVIWVFVAARAAVWYGFLFALIEAELFAARALQRLVVQSLDHPSGKELEEMLREPLGDPQLELVFLDHSVETPKIEAGPGRDATVVERDGRPRVVILHDAQLDDDPELLKAAGAVALLADENAELEAGWSEALGDLERSRIRLVRAADDERRKVERNLHDGVQQQLLALMIELGVGDDAQVDRRQLTERVRGVLEEVREVGHGLYPPVLVEEGLEAALQRVQLRSPVPLALDADHAERYSPEVESAVYYCCLEAVQNAVKHGGDGVEITVRLRGEGQHVEFDVVDDGVGFEPGQTNGIGLQNMQDRLGALGGRVTVQSAPGRGTTVSGRVSRFGG